MASVDRVIDYHSLKESNIIKVYDYIVEYVNRNYGIINVADYDNITKIKEERNKFMEAPENQFKVQKVLDQL